MLIDTEKNAKETTIEKMINLPNELKQGYWAVRKNKVGQITPSLSSTLYNANYTKILDSYDASKGRDVVNNKKYVDFGSYDDAISTFKACDSYDGLSRLMDSDDTIIVIDVDGCFLPDRSPNGSYGNFIIELVEQLDTFTLYSSSETGLHIYLSLSDKIKQKSDYSKLQFGREHCEVEFCLSHRTITDPKCKQIVVTGIVYHDAPIVTITKDELDEIYKQVKSKQPQEFKRRERIKKTSALDNVVENNSFTESNQSNQTVYTIKYETDDSLLQNAFKRNHRIQALYNGDSYDDAPKKSEYDYELSCHLVEICYRDDMSDFVKYHQIMIDNVLKLLIKSPFYQKYWFEGSEREIKKRRPGIPYWNNTIYNAYAEHLKNVAENKELMKAKSNQSNITQKEIDVKNKEIGELDKDIIKLQNELDILKKEIESSEYELNPVVIAHNKSKISDIQSKIERKELAKTKLQLAIEKKEESLRARSVQLDLSEKTMANMVISDFDGNLKYIVAFSDFYIYKDNHWQRLEPLELLKYISEKFPKLDWRVLENVYKACKLCCMVVDNPFKTYRDRIPFLNGVLVIKNENNNVEYELKPHSRDDYYTNIIPWNYTTDSNCPNTLKFLNEIFAPDADKEAKIKMLAECVGHTMIASNKERIKSIYLLYGPTAENGKSMICDLVTMIVGRKNATCVTPRDLYNGNQFKKIHLMNKLANVVADIDDNAFLPDILKSIATSDEINGERKGIDQVVFEPYCSCWFGCNSLPKADNLQGLDLRICIIPFNRSFTHDKNKRAKHKIMKELEAEIPQFINFCLEHYKDTLKNTAITESDSAREERIFWKSNNDPLESWMESCTMRVSNEEYTVTSDLTFSYNTFCRDNNYRSLKSDTFCKQLITSGFKNGKKNGKRVYFGIKLLQAGEQHTQINTDCIIDKVMDSLHAISSDSVNTDNDYKKANELIKIHAAKDLSMSYQDDLL